jgi:hypothetical protein
MLRAMIYIVRSEDIYSYNKIHTLDKKKKAILTKRTRRIYDQRCYIRVDLDICIYSERQQKEGAPLQSKHIYAKYIFSNHMYGLKEAPSFSFSPILSHKLEQSPLLPS